ncbi:MAG: HAD hydrolase-like protein [Xanthobacteraceae bacterium]|nr:HAD hydrolase-like protein [Xanthobacteraceae bacterium]
MRYKLVIFDFDGTLADSFPWFCRILNEVADRYGFRRTESHEIDALRTMGGRDLMRHFSIPAWKMPFIANYIRKRKSQELDQTRLFDGVDRTLRELSDAGVALALVTSNSEPNARAILGAENANLIRTYECGVSMFGKASRFRRVLRRTGTPAADAICIGDEIRDLEAARKAAIAFGAVVWGYTAPEALIAQTPAMVFRAVGEIAEKLAR